MSRALTRGGGRAALSSGLLIAALLVPGCQAFPGRDPAPVGDGPQSVTDCEPPFAFEGETTLAEIGLGEIGGGGGESTRRGTIQITRQTVTWEQFAPPDVPVVVPEGQLLCVTWPDGSGMTTLLAEPFGGDAGPGSRANAEMPWAVVLAALVVLALGGVSWLAFRGDPAGREEQP